MNVIGIFGFIVVFGITISSVSVNVIGLFGFIAVFGIN